jgi:hypothetical protein
MALMYSSLQRSRWAVAIAVAVVGLLLLPGIPGVSASRAAEHSAGASPAPPAPNANASLQLGSDHNLTSAFWGTTVAPWARLLPNEGALTTGTPNQVVVWPGAFAGDDFNPLGDNGNGTLWSYNNGENTPPTNESAFVAWCRSINCTAILQVPGEINNPSIAAAIVAYTVNATYTGPVWDNGVERNVTMPGLDFRPAYWEIGNEPALWSYWNEAWGHWGGYNPVSAPEYAAEENVYIQAMDHANTSYTVRMIGLPGVGRAGQLGSPATWIDAIIASNGPNLSGIAFHIYPAGDTTLSQPTLNDFYEAIDAPSPSGVAFRVAEYERTVVSACAEFGCGAQTSMPIFVTEIGTSLSHEPFGPYSLGFGGALGMSMEVIQSMSAPNGTVASIDLYLSVADTTNSWFNLTGGARPTYTAYARLFTHLGNDVFPVNVSGNPNVSAAATLAANDGGRRDLLVTNDNLTAGATFSTGFINRSSFTPGTAPRVTFKPGAPVEVWQWNGTPAAYNVTTGYTSSDPATPVPVASFYPNGLPANWTMAPQSLVLFETYDAAAYPVNFTADLNVAGYPRIPHWFIDVDGAQTSSTEPSLTLLLTTGTHSTQGLPLLEPPTGTDPKSRLVPVLPSSLAVGRAPMWVNITFQQQWALSISWNASRGSVSSPQLNGGSGPPSNGGLFWWNDSAPIHLNYTTAADYAFDRWNGYGSGSYSGNDLSATIVPTGPVVEKADFLLGTEVTFVELGLPLGTPWNVTMRGVEESSTSATIEFYEVPGTWSDQVGNVTGYQLITPGEGAWWQRSISVASTPVEVSVNYTPLDPPATQYTVTFSENGLPTGQTWWVWVRGAVESAPSPAPLPFQEVPAAYGFSAGTVGGYILASPLYFTLGAANLSVTVDFLPQNRVLWNETGLGPGLSWSVVLGGGLVLPSSGGWVTDQLLNGSYPYTVHGAQDYVPVPGEGTLDLTGTGATVDIQFVRATFAVTFDVSGLPGGDQVEIRLSDDNQTTSLSSFTFQVPNSTYLNDTYSASRTYTFDVVAPGGYYASPGGGNVSVNGHSVAIMIAILPIGPGPAPVMWLLMSAASAAIALSLAAAGAYLFLSALRRRSNRATG